MIQFQAFRDKTLNHGKAAGYGFDVHAKTHVEADRRKALERLCRYLVRPPIANSRIEVLPDGRVLVRFKRAWADGTDHITLTPLHLVEKLAALIPAPRVNMIRYHGMFAPNSKIRPLIIPRQVKLASANTVKPACGEHRRMEWARLIQRVFDIDVLECPKCRGRMQRISFITQPDVIAKMLKSVGYATAGPQPAETSILKAS